MEEEQEDAETAVVLGIPIRDPEILKATQVVYAAVGLNAFFLVLGFLQAHALGGRTPWEVATWIFETGRQMLMISTGYLGVRRSSRVLLGIFCVVSALSCLMALVQAFLDGLASRGRPLVLLRCFVAFFYFIMAYFSSFLWKKAGEGESLVSSKPRPGADGAGYSLLGIPMLDLEVLKATQTVFTSLFIIVSLLGSFVILLSGEALAPVETAVSGAGEEARRAKSRRDLRNIWFLCLAILVSMTYTGYFGVKRSSTALLTCFGCISCCFATIFLAFLVLTFVFCHWGVNCPSVVVSVFCIFAVFSAAFSSSRVLRAKAASGLLLTAPRPRPCDGVVEPTTFGSSVGSGSSGRIGPTELTERGLEMETVTSVAVDEDASSEA